MVSPPTADQFEIHVYGKGVGEAILLHLGQSRWVAIDSALSKRGEPWSIEYLESIGVDPNRIECLVITHWHSDHIAGAAKILQRSPQAKLVLSGAGKSNSFADAIKYMADNSATFKGAAQEFAELADILQKRKAATGLRNTKVVNQDTIIMAGTVLVGEQELPFRIMALSPSSEDSFAANSYFERIAATQGGLPRGIPENHASIVLLVECGSQSILLGADREISTDAERGWRSALASRMTFAPSGKSSIFKVSHHGSENGYDQNIWNESLINPCINLITCYTRGSEPLPNADMISKYKQHGDVYLASRQARSRDISRDLRGIGLQPSQILSTARSEPGSIRCLAAIADNERNWEVQLFGGAYKA